MTKISNQYSLTNILTADLANSRLGINNVSPAYSLDLTGTARVSTSAYFATASGSVGIGTTSPSEKLIVYGTSTSRPRLVVGQLTTSTPLYSTYNSQDTPAIEINTSTTSGFAGLTMSNSNNTSGNTLGTVTFAAAGTSNGEKRGAIIGSSLESVATSSVTANLIFYTTSASSVAERMRITPAGFLLVGQTASNPIISNTVGVRIGSESIFSNSSSEAVSIQRLNSTGAMVAFFYNPGSAYTPVGNISTNGSTITFSGSALSDVRYKENITPITNALESINKVDWVEFKFKENQKNSAGVTAQQLQTIDALSKFVINGSDEESYKAVDYNAIIGYLGKAIQELSAKVSLLENK